MCSSSTIPAALDPWSNAFADVPILHLNLLQKAEEQLDAAIAYKPAFLDAYLGKSSLAQLRGKLAADYVVANVK